MTSIPVEEELSPPVICSPNGSDFTGSVMFCAALASPDGSHVVGFG